MLGLGIEEKVTDDGRQQSREDARLGAGVPKSDSNRRERKCAEGLRQMEVQERAGQA